MDLWQLFVELFTKERADEAFTFCVENPGLRYRRDNGSNAMIFDIGNFYVVMYSIEGDADRECYIK